MWKTKLVPVFHTRELNFPAALLVMVVTSSHFEMAKKQSASRDPKQVLCKRVLVADAAQRRAREGESRTRQVQEGLQKTA